MRFNDFWVTGLLSLAVSGAMQAEDYAYVTNSDNTITITKYTGGAGAATIPRMTNNLPVTRIGEDTFSYYGLARVVIPDSITNIDKSAFYRCTELSSIVVNASNSFYSSAGGVLFNKKQTALIQYPGGRFGAYTIPGNVTNIGAFAFFNCYGLTSIVIPAHVASIGDHAFSGCTALTSVTFPDGIESIGDYAFSGCTKLTSIAIPSDVTDIGECAFSECAGLTSIVVNAANFLYSSADGVLFKKNQTVLMQYPGGRAGEYIVPDSVINISDFAFYSCSLSGVTIPCGVTNIGKSAFGLCPNLAAITVNTTNSFYSSAGGVLFDKNRTTLIQYPGGKSGGVYTIPAGVTSIGDSAFLNCYRLTNVTIPKGITEIGNYAFLYCNLNGITIPDSITNIGSYAFSYCNLSSITIPYRVARIGEYAFLGCAGLNAVYFRGNAPEVGEFLFQGDNKAMVYYQPEAKGWTATFGDRPATVAYLLKVDGGTGSGSYTNRQQVKIKANIPGGGKVFDRWTGATQYVAGVTSPSATVTMPTQAVTLKATYKMPAHK